MNKKNFLILTTFIVGTCSIIYELLISTASSYFLGNSVKQFSLIIGFYMASMGVGAFLSKLYKKNLLYHFIIVELFLGFIGAFSIPLCYSYFYLADFSGYNLFVFFLISSIGILTGLEVPLLTRILEDDFSLKDNISNILTFDYLGALAATIAFPFFLLPVVGIYKSSLLFGMLNIIVGFATFIFFRKELKLPKLKRNLIVLVILMLVVLISFSLFSSHSFMKRWNNGVFKYPVIYSEQSAYQDITITKNDYEFRMYLNGAIQFSSRDEYRYHEALVHLPMMQHANPKNILLLGGGEGLAAREVLKYTISTIDLVDIDPAIVKLSSNMALINELNQHSLQSDKVTIWNEDAFKFLIESNKKYDVIICDLPDPNSESLAKLYSNAFYQLVINHLNKDGLLVTQATSPTLTSKAFWCIEKTLDQVGFAYRYPYQVNMPSFGNWGFIIASHAPISWRYNQAIETRFLDKDIIEHLLYFPKDTRTENVMANNLDQPVIMDYYLDHWRRLNNEPK